LPNTLTLIAQQLRTSGSVFAEREAELLLAEAKDPGELKSIVERRVAGEPLEYILGWAEFHGQRFIVTPGVFVPRHRSEFLVDEAAKVTHAGDIVLDLCCGIGALGIALGVTVGDIRLYATDSERAAVDCARQNVRTINGEVYEGDLYASLPNDLQGHTNIILANAPYVPTDDISLMPPEARLYEPLVTLDGGVDGHDIQRRVIAGAASWLAPGGQLFIESSAHQATETAAIMRQAGLVAAIVHDADLEATVVVGTLPGQS
jgi:release factor glutamine methyltransferase